MFNKYNLSSKFKEKRNIIVMLFVSGAAWLLLLRFYNYNSYIYSTGFTVLGKNFFNQVKIDLYRTIIGLLGSVFVILIIYFVHLINFEKFNVGLAYIGKSSLAIYFVSAYLNNIVAKFTQTQSGYNYIYNGAETLFIVLICLAFTAICRKFPVVNRILFGGR